MADEKNLQAKFWKALSSDMTMMVGLDGMEDGHTRPMTAQFENDSAPIWFFASTENGLARKLVKGKGQRAIATFTSKGHDLFATLHGSLIIDNDRAVIDRLWNRSIAVWYEGGKDDPKLVLLRLDPEQGEVWLDASSVLEGMKMLLGIDSKQDAKDQVGTITFR